MQIHNVVQGTPAWDALREKSWSASVAPAMRGESPYVRRDEAIAMAATGSQREFSDWVQKNILEKGHEVEAIGRRIAEAMLDEDLYPATATEDIQGLSRPLLVSLDGMTMDGVTTFECKQYNAELFGAVKNACDCLSYRFQVVQGLVITGAARCLFMCTDGTKERTATCWIHLREGDAAALVAGWKQFERDVKNYAPPPPTVEVVGATIRELPALMIRVEGRVVDSNLGVFRQAAHDLIGAINMDLQTDQDFADAEKAIKWLKDGEDRLELVKKQALSQTATIDDLFRTIDEIRADQRDKRLVLEKTVKTRKEGIRAEIVTKARGALAVHVKALNDRLNAAARGWWPKGIAFPTVVFSDENFAGAIKGLKSIDSLRNKVNTELARCSIETSKIADLMQLNLNAFVGFAPDHAHLFTDAAALLTKSPMDLVLVIEARLRDEQARIEAEDARRKAEAEAAAQAAQAIQTAQQPPAGAHTAQAESREPAGPADAAASAGPGSSQIATSQAVGAAVIDTANKFMVGMRGSDTIIIMRPIQEMRRLDALNLAAHLVALADDNDEFPALLQAVRNT